MGVFNRMSDIINANINAILDRAENPRKMIKMITREMEETLVEVRTQSARHMAEKKRILARIDWLRSESANWERKAERAVDRNREDLARAALTEKSRLDETVTRLEADVAHIDEMVDKLKHDTTALEEKLEFARTRQKALIMRGETAQSRIKVKRQLHHVNHDDALIRFEQYERKLDDMEGMIESYELGNKSLSEEIRELAEAERLDAELEALKERQGLKQ